MTRRTAPWRARCNFPALWRSKRDPDEEFEFTHGFGVAEIRKVVVPDQNLHLVAIQGQFCMGQANAARIHEFLHCDLRGLSLGHKIVNRSVPCIIFAPGLRNLAPGRVAICTVFMYQPSRPLDMIWAIIIVPFPMSHKQSANSPVASRRDMN